MGDVYVVQLTEEDRAEIEYACRLQWAQATNPNIAHWKRRVEALQSARPENPERQSALEELAEVVTATPIDLNRIHQIKRKLRSLEGE